MNNTSKQAIYFDQLKESREGYFVEYTPPRGGERFASLALVFTQDTAVGCVQRAMTEEASTWTRRYRVPVLVSSFDEKGDTVELNKVWGKDNLVAWRRPDDTLEEHWELLKDKDIPDTALSIEYLLSTFEGVPYRTAVEVTTQADTSLRKQSKELRVGFAIIFCWAVVVPAAVAIYGWKSPAVGLIVTVYALSKAAWQAGLMLGWFKPMPIEIKKREKERRMQNYYYHCERNQAGFQRIVADNIEQDNRAQIALQARELANTSIRNG